MKIFIAVLLVFVGSSGVLQAQAATGIEGNKSNTPKTITEVINETERVYGKQVTAGNTVMTAEEITDKNLHVIGQTKGGNKIYSSATKEVVDTFIKNPQEAKNFSNAKSGYMVSWHGSYGTPMIFMDGIGWVYCIEPFAAYPSGQWYDQGTWMNDEGLKSILFWGFPSNYGGQHGLSDEEAYVRTFVALNAYIGTYNRQTVESYGDGYVNMLLAKADARDVPTETYTVHEPKNKTGHYNKETRRLETELYTVTGAAGAEFWFERLPAGFYAVGEDGKQYDKMPVGWKFRLGTENLTYNGEIKFDIKTSISPHAAIKFTSSGVQDLLSLGILDPLPAYGTSATFIPATGGFKGIKEDTNGSLVSGAVFTLFEDESGTKVVKDVHGKDVTVTTKDGVFEYPDDIVTGTYWLYEKKPDGSSGAPRGYWALED